VSNTIDVPLKKPFPGHDGQVTKIVLREPTGSEFFMLGEPQSWVRAGGGMALVDDEKVIRAYVERCIVQPDPVLAFSQMGVLDAKAVKEAMLSFFIDAESSAPSPATKSSQSETSQTT
jgi:hypothetical protein